MVDSNTYPVIIFSSIINDILEKMPEMPMEPKEPQKKHLRPLYFISFFGGLLFLFLTLNLGISLFKESEIFTGILALCFSVILLVPILGGIIMIYDAAIGNTNRNKKWKTDYEQWKTDYEQWGITIKKIKDDERKRLPRKEQKEQIVAYLNNRSSAEFFYCEENDVIKKGITENRFYDMVKDKVELMGGVVLSNIKIHILNDNWIFSQILENTIEPHYYYPDIAIIINGLYIDVEIDEPYSMDSRSPVHCIGSDDYRNSYMSSQGWEVIRFSEEQIVKYPDNCLSTIINTISHILEGRCGKPITEHNEDWIKSCWNEISARIMANNNYRESYLFDKSCNLQTTVQYTWP